MGSKVADPDGVDPDPDPACEKKPDPTNKINKSGSESDISYIIVIQSKDFERKG